MLGTNSNGSSGHVPYQNAEALDTMVVPCDMVHALAGASHVTYWECGPALHADLVRCPRFHLGWQCRAGARHGSKQIQHTC